MSGLMSGFGSVRVQAFCRVLVECAGQSGCNEDDRYGKKEAGTGEHSRHFNNKINIHK